ncbi:FAD-dependent pyridine nucleotide-disulfide oxidoreductase [Dehalogenimonas lykanthroporepellens BL-DC-9]|jgi:dihydrolipoamide dehydrogenase|nr:FAD-dependent pyridine nucleotide-disulfide oxidoreductase [Dehalogenimonas lykanthroporepellens BL-DC-9]
MENVELLVIGGGTAGETAAMTAAGRVESIAVIEQEKVGGDCIYNACIPTKALVHSARVHKKRLSAGFFGLPDCDTRVDYRRVKEAKDAIIDGIAKDRDSKLEAKGIRLFRGQARFRNSHEVTVGDTLISADRIIIATGSAPAIPPIPGLDEAGYITNVEALRMTEVPARLAIIGGGAVSVEFAQIFNAFGAHVTIFEAAERILPVEDEEISSEAKKLYQQAGMEVLTSVKIEGVKKTGRSRSITGKKADGETFSLGFDEILVATGRRPVLDGLNLKDAGVDFTRKGIIVDDTLKTSVSHIRAAGDITGIALFTFVAWQQGALAVNNMLNETAVGLDYSVLPHATFSDPEIAGVGLTEAEARAKGYRVKTGKFAFADITRAIVADETAGFIKVVTDTDSGLILGGHIIGTEASSLIHELAAAMAGGVTARKIADTFHAFPTLSEGVRYACQATLQS